MTRVFAHRGLHLDAPENSVEAFLRAKEVGCDGVELDVRRTADGALVVHHDESIDALGPISQLACRDLPGGVATLEEAMSACEGLEVNVEIKNHPSESVYDPTGSLAHQVVGALEDMGWLGDVVISSFDLATCEAVRRSDPTVPVGWLLDWKLDAAPSVETVVSRGLNAIHPFFSRVDGALVASAHARGVAVNVWTVNSVDEAARLGALDVDTIITDDPAMVMSALGLRRGSP